MKGKFKQISAIPEKNGTLLKALMDKKFGDAVAVIAKPVASAIDSVIGTNLKNCGGCKKRQESWNLNP